VVLLDKRIKSQPGLICGSKGRVASRNSRFERLRWTAVPAERPAEIPTCTLSEVLGMTTNTTSGWAYDLPNRRTRLKSVDLVRRNLRFTRSFPAGMLAEHQGGPCSSSPQARQSYQTIRFVWLFLVTVKRWRPRARRIFSTLRPSAVDMRERKPWTRTRLRILGWYVRFGM
jgi:hypothetical protein